MKLVLGAALLASCAVIAVAGCGSRAALPSSAASAIKAGSSATAPPPQVAVSPRQRAEADAAAIRASFVPPPGARRLTAAPDVDGGALKQPSGVPETPDLVDDASWWQMPGQPEAVLAWEKAHLPRRFTSAGSSVSSLRGVPTAWSDDFSLPAVPTVLASRELLVEVVSAGRGQTAIRVDAQVIWLPAKPAAERVPAAAESVTISPLPGSLAGGKPPAPVTVTNPGKVRRIASLADALPLFPPGTYNCPADFGQRLRLMFRDAGGRTLAVMEADLAGCGTVAFTVGGKSLPTLWHGPSFARQVLAIAGMRWPGI